MEDGRAFDVVVAGSGAAGLMTALAASLRGASVLVLEKSPLLGGTTAISGGQIWLPGNALMRHDGQEDKNANVVDYLRHVTLGEVDDGRLKQFAERSVYLLDFIQRHTSLKFFRVNRPDYHPDFEGAAVGRSVEPEPFDASVLQAYAPLVRQSPVRAPLTSREGADPQAADIAADRKARDVRTQGAALVAGLVHACLENGVEFVVGARLVDLVPRASRSICTWRGEEGRKTATARFGVVLASGGFEWNAALKAAFLPRSADIVPTSPPANEGDGLKIAMKVGAGIGNMLEGWWTAAAHVPGESWDGRPLYRNIVRELALPGSIMVNEAGQRFVNEAMSYNDLGKAFQTFDPQGWRYPNRKAWLVFDERFKRRYPILGVPAKSPAPRWFTSGQTLAKLARRIDVDPAGLEATVAAFNTDAVGGADPRFLRGYDSHGRTYGDPMNTPNPCLAPLSEPPFYAFKILSGCNGTKGGVLTGSHGAVLGFDGTPIPGLYACGNVAASSMGPGYPGTGGSLGPILTDALFAGEAMTIHR